MPRQFPNPLLPLLHSTTYPQLPSVSDLESIRQALAEYAYAGSGSGSASGSNGGGGGFGGSGSGSGGGAGVEGGTPGGMGDDMKRKDKKRKEREDEDRDRDRDQDREKEKERERERERAAIEANERASMRLEVAEKARVAHAQGVVVGKKKGLSGVAGKGSSASTASPTGVKVKRERSCECVLFGRGKEEADGR